MTAEGWLRERVVGAPAHLLDAMCEAARAHPSAPVPEALAAAALALYERAASGKGGREDAFPLLVADALYTHAFEAQAEAAPEALTAFADRWGAHGRLAALLR